MVFQSSCRSRGCSLADPNRIQFFRFHICFRRKSPTLEVGAPPTARRPPTGNPGSATVAGTLSMSRFPVGVGWDRGERRHGLATSNVDTGAGAFQQKYTSKRKNYDPLISEWYSPGLCCIKGYRLCYRKCLKIMGDLH